ncbi:hypothetical protein TNCV_3219631 [Trichonephila clavipes]|nr:hypothetical protein TNCV_3219631 [Trichonephila clavipes]
MPTASELVWRSSGNLSLNGIQTSSTCKRPTSTPAITLSSSTTISAKPTAPSEIRCSDKNSQPSLLNVRNTMTSDCLKNCSKLRCVDHITADTEGRKTKGCLQTNPETWGFQMFPEEEMQDIREHGNTNRSTHPFYLP